MLYLHCGWPKTGTKSLQSVLAGKHDRLAEAGLVYPERWQRWWDRGDRSHGGLVGLLSARRGGAEEALDEFVAWLEAHAEQDVMLSAESITTQLPLFGGETTFLSLLDRVRRVMPVTCIWTLRRFDDFRCSLYLQLVSFGLAVPAVDEYVRQCRGRCLFRGMKEVERRVDSVAYLEYDPRGEHNREVLEILSLPGDVADEIDRALAAAPVLNRSFSRKTTVALLNLAAIVERMGADSSLAQAWQALKGGDVEFEDDGPCALVGGSARRELHRWALESAAECGFEPYARFFAEDDAGAGLPDEVSMDPDEVLGAEDLDRLRRQLHVAVPG